MDLTSGSFQALLSWLDPDPEIAGEKYQTIRAGLVRIFVSKGFSDAEDLADLTIDRVITLLAEKRENYVGDPANLFHSVARYICLEAWRRPEVATEEPPERPVRDVDTSNEFECLLECLKWLTPDEREFLLDYHVHDSEGQVKIEHHRIMTQEQGVEESTLRVRAHRIRARLENCVLERMKSLGMKRTAPRKTSPLKNGAGSARSRER